ncbi:pyrroline-5-carboxylate reductase [Streptococcus parasuis]|uniref:pyrroline-5-carboxylate reductase n=1 Tax=Streptococcus parasuis TaxID=1501662 RepID=UPI002898CC5A|nr:pyrroline-5-carboxylate reductase [Streptococcus parasuis]
MKIGFIGLGNMGAALAQAVSQQADTQLLLSNHNPVKAHALQEKVGGQLFSNGEIAEQAEVIFLGVKPHLIQSVLSGLQDQISQNPSAIWISMAAGVTLNSLEEFVSADKLIRIMPNTPVAIGQGMTTYSVVNQELAPLLEQILEKTGKVQQVPEKLIDAATAIAGCGPAFVYLMIEALTDAGVQNGLTAEDAKILSAQTLAGTAQMVLYSDKHPAQLRQEVTSPGGSTIAGVVALEKEGFRDAVIKAVAAALKKTRKLGKK